MRQRLLLAALLTVYEHCLADLNPNPTLRTVDLLVDKGRCEPALVLLRKAASRDEPWAMFRLGALSLNMRCPDLSKEDAHQLLVRTACRTTRNAWERGDESAEGEPGYFNAGFSSARAARALANYARANGDVPLWWRWMKREGSYFAEQSETRIRHEEWLAKFKSAQTAERQALLVDESPCP